VRKRANRGPGHYSFTTTTVSKDPAKTIPPDRPTKSADREITVREKDETVESVNRDRALFVGNGCWP